VVALAAALAGADVLARGDVVGQDVHGELESASACSTALRRSARDGAGPRQGPKGAATTAA
jgi:hypothetical protein